MGMVPILELKGYSERVQGRMPRGVPTVRYVDTLLQGKRGGTIAVLCTEYCFQY